MPDRTYIAKEEKSVLGFKVAKIISLLPGRHTVRDCKLKPVCVCVHVRTYV
jgi:hypothetical protein